MLIASGLAAIKMVQPEIPDSIVNSKQFKDLLAPQIKQKQQMMQKNFDLLEIIAEELSKTLWELLDENHDGKVTRKEFIKNLLSAASAAGCKVEVGLPQKQKYQSAKDILDQNAAKKNK